MVSMLMATGGDVAATAIGTMCELGWTGAAGVMVVVAEYFTANLNWLNAGVHQPLQEGPALLAVSHICYGSPCCCSSEDGWVWEAHGGWSDQYWAVHSHKIPIHLSQDQPQMNWGWYLCRWVQKLRCDTLVVRRTRQTTDDAYASELN